MKGWLAPLLLAAACATTRGRPVSAAGELAYRITHPAAPRTLELEIRRVRGAPAAFSFSTPGAVDRVRAELVDGQQVELEVPASGELELPNDWVALRYRYSLEQVHRSFGSTDLSWGLASEDDLLLPGAAWLLRPRIARPDLTATILGPGSPALLPWEPQAEGRWSVSSQELIDSGFQAFGGRRCQLTVGEGKLEVALIGAPHPLGDSAICEWLRSSAAEVLQVRREFPVTRATIAIAPVLSNEASPFGRILPGTPRSLAFLVGTQAGPEEFARDWVAVHQLLHLAHPPLGPGERWLSEGLATFYTEVARARSGRQTPERAWEELLEGFELGAAEAGGAKMEEVIAEGGGSRARSTAWAGALFLLALDLELRQRTAGARSVGDVLDAIGSHLPQSLHSFGAQVDAVAGAPIFDRLLSSHLGQPAFAPLEGLLQKLGVHRREGQVTLEPGPLAAERDALMRMKLKAGP